MSSAIYSVLLLPFQYGCLLFLLLALLQQLEFAVLRWLRVVRECWVSGLRGQWGQRPEGLDWPAGFGLEFVKEILLDTVCDIHQGGEPGALGMSGGYSHSPEPHLGASVRGCWTWAWDRRMACRKWGRSRWGAIFKTRPRQDKKPSFIFLAPVTWSVTSGRYQCCIRGAPLREQRREKVGRLLGSRKKGSHGGCSRLEEKLEGLRRWPAVQVATFRTTWTSYMRPAPWRFWRS